MPSCQSSTPRPTGTTCIISYLGATRCCSTVRMPSGPQTHPVGGRRQRGGERTEVAPLLLVAVARAHGAHRRLCNLAAPSLHSAPSARGSACRIRSREGCRRRPSSRRRRKSAPPAVIAGHHEPPARSKSPRTWSLFGVHQTYLARGLAASAPLFAPPPRRARAGFG